MNEILRDANLTELTVKTKDRFKSPILSGSTTASKHKKAQKLLAGKCQVKELHDLANIHMDPLEKQARIEFETDEFNNSVAIRGRLNPVQVAEVLQTVKQNYPNITLLQYLQADEKIEDSDIVINLSLALTQIEEVELTEITLTPLAITIKGLVRDKSIKNKVLKQFRELFQEDLNIIDQLEEVVKSEVDLEAIDMEFNKIPILDQSGNL